MAFLRMENIPRETGKLAVQILDASADPLVFVFHATQHPAPAQVLISRHAWRTLGPSQAIAYVVDRYLLAYPREEQRVGRAQVISCVQQALAAAPL